MTSARLSAFWALFKPHGNSMKLGYYFLFFDNLHKVTKIIRGETTCPHRDGLPPDLRLHGAVLGAVFSLSLAFSENLWHLTVIRGFLSKMHQYVLVENLQSGIFWIVNFFLMKIWCKWNFQSQNKRCFQRIGERILDLEFRTLNHSNIFFLFYQI